MGVLFSGWDRAYCSHTPYYPCLAMDVDVDHPLRVGCRLLLWAYGIIDGSGEHEEDRLFPLHGKFVS